jgi:hypothetical protein
MTSETGIEGGGSGDEVDIMSNSIARVAALEHLLNLYDGCNQSDNAEFSMNNTFFITYRRQGTHSLFFTLTCIQSRPFSGYIFVAGVQIRLCTPFFHVCISCLGKNDLYASCISMEIRFFRVFHSFSERKRPKNLFVDRVSLSTLNRRNLKFFLENPRDGNPYCRLKTKKFSKSHHRNSMGLDEHSISC